MTPEPSNLRTARENTIDALCRGFAADDLSLPELERRLETARAARSRQELAALLADLRPSVDPLPGASGGSVPSTHGTDPVSPRRPRDPGSRPAPARDSARRTSGHLAFAVMGGTRRAGRWVPPSNIAAVALMGGVELDFREAVLSGGDIEISCFAFWGGVEIVVPPHVHVDTRGIALMGGFDQQAELPTDPGPDAPTIRVTGLALMGGVEVRVAARE